LLSELLVPNEAMRDALRSNASAQRLTALAVEAGCEGLWKRGVDVVKSGRATYDDLRRILAPTTGGA